MTTTVIRRRFHNTLLGFILRWALLQVSNSKSLLSWSYHTFVWTQIITSQSYMCMKIATSFFLSISVAHVLFSWAAQHTNVCLDTEGTIGYTCTVKIYIEVNQERQWYLYSCMHFMYDNTSSKHKFAPITEKNFFGVEHVGLHEIYDHRLSLACWWMVDQFSVG